MRRAASTPVLSPHAGDYTRWLGDYLFGRQQPTQ
jgi:hypothetical protein